MMNQVIYLYLLCIMEFSTVMLTGESDSCAVEQVDEKNGRHERALLFPPSSTIGVRVFFCVKILKTIKESKLTKKQSWI